MSMEGITDTVEARVMGSTPEERVRRAIKDAQERRDTPLDCGFGIDLDEVGFISPRVTRGVSYAGEEDVVISWPRPRSEAMAAFINRPA